MDVGVDLLVETLDGVQVRGDDRLRVELSGLDEASRFFGRELARGSSDHSSSATV